MQYNTFPPIIQNYMTILASTVSKNSEHFETYEDYKTFEDYCEGLDLVEYSAHILNAIPQAPLFTKICTIHKYLSDILTNENNIVYNELHILHNCLDAMVEADLINRVDYEYYPVFWKK